ncbi:hypothetical protein SAMN05444395_102203 [Flavobacterium fryxellicola]|uniref:DUF2306 domain-containing protein n=1 Tax=Flavobacterium fryxellicola TaxID=249352 RepID=A0A167Y555_9FLAO|nr:hypothetical protein [Flavobacterium fryxellicola]OAB29038.1 hypothetical protein FBFR_06205 [Flavobacterium fryxellicola]SHN58986.1 hypothetical protein SAMN05444395_102203 [Flavobacterium fryxellicola]
MEQAIKVLIYTHAFFGGVGLITGIGSIIVPKGQQLHKKMGKLFSIGMITSSLISLPICSIPKHQNVFLFLIGLFTIYLVLSGNRALTFKRKMKSDLIDQLISGTMLFFSLIMISLGIYCQFNSTENGILFTFFGGFGLFMTIKDFVFYATISATNKNWLSKHIGKMIGALIASITAFIVAGLGFENLIAWITPTILGTIYIIYWNKKTERKVPKTIKIRIKNQSDS